MKNFKHAFVLLTAAAVLAACSQGAPTALPIEEGLENFEPGVNASGEVVPVRFASLSVNVPGVVEAVFVNAGDHVEAGQPLLQIRGGEQAQAAVAAAEFELTGAQNALADLYKDTDLIAANALKTAEDAEDALEDLYNRELQEALALKAIADAEKAVEDTERLYNYAISTAGEADIELAQAQVVLARDALDKAIEDFEPHEDKPEDNLVRANLLARKAAAQQVYDAAVRQLNALLGTGSESDIAVAAANLAAARALLIQAQRDYERVQEGPSAGETAALEAQIASAMEDNRIYSEGPDPADVSAAAARIANAEAQLAAAQAGLGDLQLLAPFAGTISELNINASEWVSPGQPVIVLADLDHLRVETTDLSEIDVARIAPGDPVTVTFDALPGTVAGSVVSISPRASQGSGVNYTVVVAMSETPEGLRWGMTAFVDVELDN
ncbi:MAG TPA: HlyD family efflux transporter periplasmic adaptor subunit [Anaerolineales bacterium]|nr:HlyD family efflux transporter periplasmic adaptor subunit [Anaerolineales bacterium]